MDIIQRPRRLRTSETLRKMVRETRMDKSSLIYPLFVMEGNNKKEEITSMPGQYRYSVDCIEEKITDLLKNGVNKIILFGIPQQKDEVGSQAYAEDGIVQRAMEQIKKSCPDIYLIGDVCMCEYTSHGHCGILEKDYVNNDKTVEYLKKIALSQVQAGADMVAPSDMMDGRIREIRRYLDKNNYINIPIMSYAAKFASSFYGPFREAADSAPSFGDRKSYQMDYHNSREAMKEVITDYEEGADIIMIKPAMAYGDLIRQAKTITNVPIAAYSVSGEYAMIKAASQNGWIDEEKMMCEIAACAYRAGADIYITYYAKELAMCMDQGIIG